jgi:hypothetical protein
MDKRTQGLLRALIYPIQFEKDPTAVADKVIEWVVEGGALKGTRMEYQAAVNTGLGSDERLSDLIPQDHSESVIRAYLQEVQRGLESLIRATGGSDT